MYSLSFPNGHSNLTLTSKCAQYHGTTSIDQSLTLCSNCQIANIIWTSTHEVKMMSIMCLENDTWQKYLVKTILVEKKHLG